MKLRGYWGRVLAALLVGCSTTFAQAENVYLDALGASWDNWSWSGTYYFTNASPVYAGTNSIKISQEAWSALSLHHPSIASNAYAYVEFYIHGGTVGGQQLQVWLQDDNTGTNSAAVNLNDYLVAGGNVAAGIWKLVSIPFTAFALTTPSFTRFDILNWTGATIPTYYIDSITLRQTPSIAPQLISTQAGGTRSVVAFFDMGLTIVSATNRLNYGLQSTNDSHYASRIAPTVAVYDTNRWRVALTFTNDFINGGRYKLYCNNLTNLNGTAISPDTAGAFGFSNHTIQVSVLVSNHTISPLIYGVAWAPSTNYLHDIGATVHRWGGNRVSTYNWVSNLSNAGADWYFENSGDSGSSGALQFAQDTAAAGASPLLSVAALPFIAKDSTSHSFSVAKYGPQQATDPYNSDAGNGIGTNGQKIVNNPLDSGMTNTVAFQAQWLRNLQSNSVALPFIAIDNEVDIWDGTHRDWHPAPMSYDELWNVFTNYATMIRAESPASQILAPVSCCWWFYWNSAAGGGDKATHGGVDFLEWFLDTAYARNVQTGQRLLDVLDIHYYADALNDGSNPARQLRSARELWDVTYTSEGGIGTDQWATQTQPNRNQPNIIPRFKNLIAQHYPGTKLAITEYNWGADTTLPGGLALADVLGIFGREDLYLATYWTAPDAASPAYQMFKLYRNYDGNGAKFLPVSVFANTSEPNLLTAYAAKDTTNNALTVIVINKNPDYDYNTQLQLTGYSPSPTAAVYRVSGANTNAIVREPDLTNVAANTTFVFPAYSATLLRMTIASTLNDGIPAWWRSQYFDGDGTTTNALSCANCDPDGDGQNNLAEYLSGTVPTNNVSVLALISVTTDANGFNTVTWKSVGGLSYRVQYSDGDANGGYNGAFSDITTVTDPNSTGTPGTMSFTDDYSVTPEPVNGARYYRVQLDNQQVFTPQPVGRMLLALAVGRNHVALPLVPVTNTLAGVLGTNQLPAAATESAATVADVWDQPGQTLTNRYWLSNVAGFAGWRRTDFSDANGVLLDANKGLILTLRTGAGTVSVAGFVPNTAQIQTVQNNGYSLAGSRFPMAVALTNSGLQASGFVGGTSLVTSDNLYFFNPAAQAYDIKIWLDTGGVWRNADASIATNALMPGVSFLIRRRNRATDMTWTNTLPYSTGS